MATLEERVQALEQEHTHLKKTIELQTIAIRAFVSKEAFEKLQDTVGKIQENIKESQEQNGKLFNILINHSDLTNKQLAELRTQQIELDGKIVGLQTETRQRFDQVDTHLHQVDTRFDQVDTHLNNIEETMATKEHIIAMESRILQAITRAQRPQPE